MIKSKNLTLICLLLLLAASQASAQTGRHWQCDVYEYQYDMTLFFSLEYNGTMVADISDFELAAFVNDECRGVGSIQMVTPSDATSAKYGYLRVRSNLSEGEEISFKAYHFLTGQVMDISQTMPFEAESLTGMPSTPYKLSLLGLLSGDANVDGVVDVADVVAVVNKILNKASGNFNEAAANVNGDEGIDVADVVGIVNIILGKRTSARGEKTDVVMTDNDRVSLCNLEDGSLSLCLENEGSYVAAQFDIRLSDGQQLEGISLNNGRADGHCLTYSQVEPNLWRVLIYSMDGAALRGNDGELLNIRVIGSVSIGQIFFVMPDMGKRQFSPLDSQLTGIGSYGILQSPADVYSTDGRLVKKQATSLRGLPKGVYIIRGQKFVNW